MNIGVFHPGTQHSWQTALALQDLDRLAWFATSLFYRPDRFPYFLERIPGPVGRRLTYEFRRFAVPGLNPELVRASGVAEWLERLAARAGLRGLAGRIDAWGNSRFVDQIAAPIRSGDRFALWGYNSSSLETFALARKVGRTCVLDRTIGDFRAYNAAMADLQDQYGDWFLAEQKEVPARVIEREAAEHVLAHRIVVGCEFAAKTLGDCGGPEIASKVEVLEYCFDEGRFGALPPPQPRPAGQPVRFLFLGLAIPRKGIHHVLEAIAALPRSEAELTIVGQLGVPGSMFSRYADRIDYRPTVPRADVPQIMAAHDVLVFPSYFEGAGIVLYEALAAGMGLIQSDRAAIAVTPDTGILLPELGTEALLAAMRRPIEDPAMLDHWRASAQAAAQAYRFAGYRGRIASLLDRMGI